MDAGSGVEKEVFRGAGEVGVLRPLAPPAPAPPAVFVAAKVEDGDGNDGDGSLERAVSLPQLFSKEGTRRAVVG